MKNRFLTFAGALVSLSAIGNFSAPSLMAQARPALVQDTDQAARAPFQATVSVNINNFNYTPVSIPSGFRLVIDFVSLSGAAQTAGPYVQPIILLNTSVAGNANAVYYIGPQQSGTAPGQYYHDEKVAIYADSLLVGPAFAGYNPTFMAFNVVISGHLVKIP